MAQEPVVVGPPRRKWPRRILIGLNIFVAFCLVGAAASYGYFKYRLGQIPRINVGDVLRNRGDDDPGKPMNVLLVGSDSRKNVSKQETKAFGSEKHVPGERSDTIIVLHVDPKSTKASVLSIPRDLYVPIADTTRTDRINSAFEGGAERLIRTIKGALGIEIDHYAEVDFNGFRGIVNSIEGVNVYFPSPARDSYTGLNIPKAGCVALDGDGALKYVRSRHYQYYESGRWREDGTADLGRIERQQDFIRRIMHKAVRVGRNPATLNALVGNAVKNVTLDDAFSPKDIVRLASKFKSLDPESVEMIPIPTIQTRVGTASVLKLKQPDADEALARFRGELPQAQAAPTTVPNILPSTVRVRVQNGSGIDGQASDAATKLRDEGFATAGSPGDADSAKYVKSLIKHPPGQQEKAKLLQAYVGGASTLQEDRTVRDLVLVTGAEFTGIRAPNAPPAATTSTTASAKGTTTTTAPGKPAPAPQPAC